MRSCGLQLESGSSCCPTSVDGSRLQCLGTARGTVQVGETTRLDHVFNVVEGISVDLILGMDFIGRATSELRININNKTVFFNDEAVPFFTNSSKIQMVTGTLVARIECNINVPARSEKLVWLRVKSKDEQGVFEPNAEFTQETGLLASRVLALSADQRIPVLMCNLGSEAVTLYANKAVGEFEAADVLEPVGNVKEKLKNWDVNPELTELERDKLMTILKANDDLFSTHEFDLGSTSRDALLQSVFKALTEGREHLSNSGQQKVEEFLGDDGIEIGPHGALLPHTNSGASDTLDYVEDVQKRLLQSRRLVHQKLQSAQTERNERYNKDRRGSLQLTDEQQPAPATSTSPEQLGVPDAWAQLSGGNDDDDGDTEAAIDPVVPPALRRSVAWTRVDIGLVEASFFVGYALFSVPGGLLASRLSAPGRLLGAAVLATCSLNLLVPAAAHLEPAGLAFAAASLVRAAQGAAEGCLYPCVHALWRYWAPAMERSRLVTISFFGMALGPIVGLPLSGAMTDRLGWPANFYAYGVAGCLWAAVWLSLVPGQPAWDRYIGDAELRYILATSAQSRVGSAAPSTMGRLPIRSILTSLPVWGIVLANIGRNWTFQFSTIGLPAYYAKVFNLDSEAVGLHLMAPFALMAALTPVGGILADSLRSRLLSTTSTRKLLNTVGFGTMACCMALIGLSRSPYLSTSLLTIGFGFTGLGMSGYGVNHLDIAPLLAGFLMGLSNGIGTVSGIAAGIAFGWGFFRRDFEVWYGRSYVPAYSAGEHNGNSFGLREFQSVVIGPGFSFADKDLHQIPERAGRWPCHNCSDVVSIPDFKDAVRSRVAQKSVHDQVPERRGEDSALGSTLTDSGGGSLPKKLGSDRTVRDHVHDPPYEGSVSFAVLKGPLKCFKDDVVEGANNVKKKSQGVTVTQYRPFNLLDYRMQGAVSRPPGTEGVLIIVEGHCCVLSPILASRVTRRGTVEEWRTVFLVAACVHAVTVACYYCMASGDPQPWSDPSETVRLIESSATSAPTAAVKPFRDSDDTDETEDTKEQPAEAIQTEEWHEKSQILGDRMKSRSQTGTNLVPVQQVGLGSNPQIAQQFIQALSQPWRGLPSRRVNAEEHAEAAAPAPGFDCVQDAGKLQLQQAGGVHVAAQPGLQEVYRPDVDESRAAMGGRRASTAGTVGTGRGPSGCSGGGGGWRLGVVHSARDQEVLVVTSISMPTYSALEARSRSCSAESSPSLPDRIGGRWRNAESDEVEKPEPASEPEVGEPDDAEDAEPPPASTVESVADAAVLTGRSPEPPPHQFAPLLQLFKSQNVDRPFVVVESHANGVRLHAAQARQPRQMRHPRPHRRRHRQLHEGLHLEKVNQSQPAAVLRVQRVFEADVLVFGAVLDGGRRRCAGGGGGFRSGRQVVCHAFAASEHHVADNAAQVQADDEAKQQHEADRRVHQADQEAHDQATHQAGQRGAPVEEFEGRPKIGRPGQVESSAGQFLTSTSRKDSSTAGTGLPDFVVMAAGVSGRPNKPSLARAARILEAPIKLPSAADRVAATTPIKTNGAQ
uniref:MFS domain-containing protein n=1 Tax=Macrostomum lignano TaxID=282301 RepID=A0A1I8JLD1_9PLAT